MIKDHSEGHRKPILEVLKSAYGENDQIRTVMSRLMTKAAVIPADTTTSGWADTLVQTVIQDLVQSLIPVSIYGKLAALGNAYVLGRNGAVLLPSRNTVATVSGAFVAQGSPIPVKQGQFLGVSMTPKKLGVITTMTREIYEHSIPSIESVLRVAMVQDTGTAIDSILLDNGAATTTRPAGLKNGVTKITASGTASIVGFVADLKALAGALITATKSDLRAPVWIMNTSDALAAGLLPASTGGDFPFSDSLAMGMLIGIPVLTSANVATDVMYIVDAADFATIASDTPDFDISDMVTLHEEDTTPLAIGTPGSPPTVAAPTKNMFQQDSVAVRMKWGINWAMVRASVAWTDTMAWN